MYRQNVVSSDIKSVGYDSETRVLEIEFNTGNIYNYYDVPPNVYIELLEASSKGSYFHENIINIYRYSKI